MYYIHYYLYLEHYMSNISDHHNMDAQQHRMTVGMFAGGRCPPPPWSGRGQGRSAWSWSVLILAMIIMVKAICCMINLPNTFISQMQTSCVFDTCFYLTIAGVVCELLLLLSGDVEKNPGPVDAEKKSVVEQSDSRGQKKCINCDKKYNNRAIPEVCECGCFLGEGNIFLIR